jgi:hypothetical protein
VNLDCSLVVTTSADVVDASDGVTSLREAILCANNNLGLETIAFDIPGAGVQSISPTSALPTITDPVVIDGYTQPGASPNTLAVGNDAVLLIELNGAGATFGALNITAGTSTVRGLVINRFSGNGPTTAITLDAAGNNTITGNFIGTNTTGTEAAGFNNGRSGISITNTSPGNTIGGVAPASRNVILGAGGVGAVFAESPGNTIQGNYIASNAAGSAALGEQSGIRLTSANNLIGGAVAGTRNVISTLAAGAPGISFLEGNSNNNIVQGNYIGLTADGNAVLGTGGVAVLIQRGNGNLIGGATPEARNVIVTAGAGVVILGSINLGQNNTIQGNYIGTNAAGAALLPAAGGGPGVQTSDAAGNIIGGVTAGAGNLIAGRTIGVDLQLGTGNLASGNLVQGNFIGANAAGAVALGNVTGIRIGGFFGIRNTNNTIGGTAPGAGNLISGNTGDGLLIGAGDGNLIQGNRIGVAADGATALGNGGDGVKISDGANNTVGGTTAGAGNSVAFNGGDGVFVGFGAGNTILANSIHSNVGLGIDLGTNGVTANDADDPDTGANDLYNFPILRSAWLNDSSLTLTGIARPDSQIELFLADSDPTGFGEGRTILITLTEGSLEDLDAATGTYGPRPVNRLNQGTDTANAFRFAIPIASFLFPVSAGAALTSTGTDSIGNTSEFSGNVLVQALGCPQPYPDFNMDGRVDVADLLGLIRGTQDDDTDFDITGEGTTADEDLLKFSLSWYGENCVQ